MRVVIAEDHGMFREVVSKACSQFGHQVIAESSQTNETYTLCSQFHPEVLILDIGLKDGDGFSVISKLQRDSSAPKILVVSCYFDDFTLMCSEHPLIVGFVDKGVSALRLIGEALAAISRGQTYFSSEFQRNKSERERHLRLLRSLLTEWECAILSLIGSGLPDEEIAEQLRISPRTVQGHRSILMKKLGLQGTPRLMVFALAHGYCVQHGADLRPRGYEILESGPHAFML